MMRPLAAIALLALALAACGGDDGASPSATPSESPFLTATPAPSPVNPSRDQLTFLIDGELYLVDSDGMGKTQLGEDGICPRSSSLSWSSDGSRLVCSGGASTVLLESDGTPLGQWTDAPGVDVQWSSTGDAFALRVKDRLVVRDRGGAALADLDPPDPRPGGISVDGRSRLWSPDGKQIAYWDAASSELRVYSLETGSERTVVGDYRPLVWLSDGNTIVAAAGYEPSVEPGFTLYDIVLVDTSTGSTSPVPELKATPDGPIRANLQLWFSPDTSKVAVLTTRPDGFPGMGVFDMQTRTLTQVPDSIISFPSDHIPQDNVRWSADGKTLYWIDMGGPATLYRAGADGTGLARLMDFPMIGGLSPDLRSIAYVDVASDLSGSLYISEVDGGAPRMIDSHPADDGASPNYSWTWRPVP